MSRWWRAYDEAVDDPKLILLSDKAHRAWFNLMCVASAYGGLLPEIKIIAVKLRVTPQQASAIIAELVGADLIDRRDDGKFEPHNWNSRQYKSDADPTATTRKRKQRERDKLNGHGHVTRDITLVSHPPETEAETERTEADASGAEAPDLRSRLFREGLAKIAAMTGKGPDSCRTFVGKCLKEASDDAGVVLGLIEDAERNRVVDPAAWIAARLKGTRNGQQAGSKIIQAADDLRRKIASFDGPAGAPDRLRGGSIQVAPRLLPHR